MKRVLGLLILSLGLSNLALAAATPGEPAPAFEAKDITGQTRKLSDYKGKWVVMEWSNKDCPYVKKHYGSGNMQALQKKYTAQSVVWLTVLSSAKGKEGYMEASDAAKYASEKNVAATTTLMDSSGTVGKLYGAKTTPHMFVIDPQGKLAYAGAIDDNDSSDPAVIAKSKNYVAQALDFGLAGKKIETASVRPYGCGVKY